MCYGAAMRPRTGQRLARQFFGPLKIAVARTVRLRWPFPLVWVSGIGPYCFLTESGDARVRVSRVRGILATINTQFLNKTGKKAADFSLKFNEKFNLMRNQQLFFLPGALPVMKAGAPGNNQGRSA